MRECALCHHRTADHIAVCPECGADFSTNSVRARALKAIIASPRSTHVYIVAPDAACPTCRTLQGTYDKTGPVPQLPLEGCSCKDGCQCQYEPLVIEVGP